MTDRGKGTRSAALFTGTALGAALGATFGMLLAATGSGPASAASAPAAIAFEELHIAPLAGRDRDTDEWAVRSDAQVPDQVLAWLTARLGPIARRADPTAEQRPLRGSLWRTMLPDQLELYIFEELGPVVRSPTFVLLLRDTTTGALATRAPQLDANFHDMGVSKGPPRLHRVRLDDRAPWQLALRTYEHNGTMHNAETVLFFEPQRRGGGIELHQVLRIWTAMHWPFGDHDHVREGGVFAASLQQGNGELRLAEYYEHAARGTPRRPSASGRYVRNAAGEAFRLVDLEVIDKCSPQPRD